MAVTQDATSGWYLPSSLAEARQLWGGSTCDMPSSIWTMQESSGTVDDKVGTNDLTVSSLTYSRVVSGWSRTGIGATVDGGAGVMSTTAIGDTTTASQLVLALVAVDSAPGATRDILGIGGGAGFRGAQIQPHLAYKAVPNDASSSAYGSKSVGATVHAVAVQVNRTAGTWRVITEAETVTPSPYSAPAGGTAAVFFGAALSSTPAFSVLWAAAWSSTAAEMSDAQIRELIRRMREGSTNTLTAMQAGRVPSTRFIALIEGCKYILSDHPDEDVVQSALVGTDWGTAELVPWLTVDLHNEQSITPLDAFTPNMSKCVLRVGDSDRLDTFGTFINKRLSGGETELAETVTRSTSTITVKSTTPFPNSGEIYIGNECIGYGGRTATTFTTLTRGKYSPFGCDESGTGGTRFAGHHRVSRDANHVQLQPLVTQLPRTWTGKRVGIWIHTTDGTYLNSKADAQLVFAGRLASISDDSNTGETVLEMEPLLEEVRNHVVGKEIWSAEIGEGITLVTGRTFTFADFREGSAVLTANTLVVVSGAPASANEVQAGRYSLSELCSVISKWLASEKAAARIYGYYTLASPVETSSGVRTRMRWRHDHGSTIRCNFKLGMPGEIASFLGIYDAEPGTLSDGVSFAGGSGRLTNTDHVTDGAAVPYVSIVFRPYGPGRIGQEFSDLATTYAVSHERGTFLDQYSLMPASIKSACVAGNPWGFFILDEKTLLVGSYDDGVLTNCWMPPFQLTADRETDATTYIGRRADDVEGGPVLLRQVFLFESSFSTLFLQLLFSTGTSGYSNSEFDTLAYGLGLGIPGSLMGDPMIRTVENMPGADQTLGVFIDEPTRFEELFSGDFTFRRMFLRWKDQGIEACQWVSPTTGAAVATFEEANKAAPSGMQVNHRTPSVEAQITQRPIVKIDFCPDFATGRQRQYLKSVMFEDQVAVDDLGGSARIETIKLRNTFQQFANAGASIETLTSKFLEFFPCVSRPWRALSRSIDLRFYEGYSIGDVFLVNDAFARDPVTGQREIAERPAVVTRHWYDWTSMDGGVELMFLDAQRQGTVCPTARVDDTASAGGFSAGYNNGTATLRCYEQTFSHDVTITTHGLESTIVAEEADATHFDAGDKVLIYELNPADPAAADYWERTVLSQSGNDIVLTSTLSSPAWDANKKYAITFQKYSQVQTSQQDFSYQADSADFMVEDTEAPYHYQSPNEDRYYNAWTG